MTITRRTFAAMAAAAPLVFEGKALGQAKKLPVGLELFSVRDELMKDEMATVRAVAKMGYEVVEFYAPYFSWSTEHARDIRKLMDDLGIKCNSTHNNATNFSTANLAKTIELNQIIGSRYAIAASAPAVRSIDAWKQWGEEMTKVSAQMKKSGMATGFHNHQTEWRALEGQRPMDVLAANTPPEFVLQFDVGTCIDAGADPIAWIKAHPGRIKSVHCKDWGAGQGPDRGYRVLFGEGDSPWKAIFETAEAVGGVEYYLIEQEGSRFPAFETAEKCLATYRKMRR
ncbi:MAG: sugar phosphate isomerase/epimerase [Acidobacteriota bacterium]